MTYSFRGMRNASICVGALYLLQWGSVSSAADYTAIFTTKGQSVYTGGPAVDVNSGTRRLGPGPQDIGKSYGKVFDPCGDPLPSCATGAEAGADVHFNFGLNYGLKLNSGSFDAQYPVNVHITAPADYTNEVGNPFKLQSSFDVPGFTSPQIQFALGGTLVGAKLQVHSPTIEAFVDMDARFEAFVGARACVAGVCQGPSLGRYKVDASRNLVELNRNGNGIVKIGDLTANLNQYFTTLDGNLTARLNIPNLDAVSSVFNGSSPTNLLTRSRGNVAALNANLSALVSKLLPVPLSGNLGGIGYNLLSAAGGISLDLQQTLSLSLTPMQTYNFLLPVRQQFADGSLSDFTKQITTPLGQEITLVSGQRNLGIVPITSLMATLNSQTSLVIGGDVNVQALAANIFGFDIGPLYDSGSINGGLFSIPIFENSFAVPFGSVIGTPFNIAQTNLLSGPADIGSRALLRVVGDDPDYPSVYTTEILSQNLDCLAFICPPTFLMDGSPASLDLFGNLVFLTAPDGIALPGILPGILGTDADQIAGLAATGFTTDRETLVSPLGDPRPPGSIPEPASWMMMMLGLGSVGAGMRQRSRKRAISGLISSGG